MEITEDIGEIIGRHIADGYLVKNPKRNGYRVVLTEKREILEDQIKKIEKYFAITSFRIAKRKDENIYDLIVYSKQLYNFIKDLGIPQRKESNRSIIPKMFWNLPLNVKKRIARGIIDCDGSLWFDKSNKRFVIELNMISRDVILFISHTFEKLGISHYVTIKKRKPKNRKTSYSLRIIGKEVKNYLDIVGSCILTVPSR